MSAKNRDKHGRWRARTIAFRVSDAENQSIDEMVALCGLTKQDYILTRALERDVVVYGNPKVFKALKSKMDEIILQLNRIEKSSDFNDEFMDSLKTVMTIYTQMIAREGKN